MTVTDDEDVTGLDDLLLGVELVHHLALQTQAYEYEVHAAGLRRHGGFVDMFCQQEVIVEHDGFTPGLGLVQVRFFDSRCYHVLILCVLPAFNFTVFCWPLYNRVTVPFFWALMSHFLTLPPFHSKLTS